MTALPAFLPIALITVLATRTPDTGPASTKRIPLLLSLNKTTVRHPGSRSVIDHDLLPFPAWPTDWLQTFRLKLLVFSKFKSVTLYFDLFEMCD
jgi:hypothetical protein